MERKKSHALPLVKVTTAETHLTAGSLVKGAVHVDRSALVIELQRHAATGRQEVLLRVGLAGREVTQVHRGYRNVVDKKDPILYKQRRVFFSKQTTWDSQDLLLIQQRQHLGAADDDENLLSLDFALPLPNDLPASFSQEIPLDSSSIHFPMSACRVEYLLQASLVVVTRTVADSSATTTTMTASPSTLPTASSSSKPCVLRIRRLIHQALHNQVGLHIANVISRPQVVFCGLWEQTYETFVVQPTLTRQDDDIITWSPTRQSAVTIRLTDPKAFLTSSNSTAIPGTVYRLQVKMVQRVSWQAHQHGSMPVEQSWTLEPCLFWKATTIPTGSTTVLVDGEVVLPTTMQLHESYMQGQLIQVEHHVVFTIHQKKRTASEWTLVGSSTQIPLRIQR